MKLENENNKFFLTNLDESYFHHNILFKSIKDKFQLNLKIFFLLHKMLKRIISKIDVKSSNVVKGINLEGLRVLGKLRFCKILL